MKKSFMTRTLATGLSLAMAFSLTAATNVTTAAAAAKPAMKASQMTVKEGKSKTFLATAKTLKTYKITKAKVKNASAKQYISVKKNAKGTGIVVTGKKGADTARKIVITFQNKKTKKTTNLTTKVVVKAVEKPEEPTIASDIESAAAVGAKTVKVVFNGDLTTTSGVAISVKKGSTELTKDSVAFNDSKTATVTLKNGLTAGTYTAVATGVVSGTSLSKDFSVESDEYVAKIELTSDKAPMEGTDSGTVSSKDSSRKKNQVASVGYVLKNQYDEVINGNVNAITWTVSTGVTVGNTDYTYKNGVGSLTIKTATTTSFVPGNEVFINAVLTNGTHVATMSGKAQIVLPANFDKANIAGVYNKTLKKMDTVSSAKLAATKNPYVYQLLFTAQDQYGNDMDADTVAAKGATLFTALSNNPIFIQTSSTFETVDVDGKTYIAMTLTAGNLADKGGTATIQMISSSTGTKSTYDIVADAAGAVDKFTLGSPAGYAVQDEKLEIPFTAVDQYGNEVTAYDSLNGKIALNQSEGKSFKFEKKTDGTAKLVLDLNGVAVPAHQDKPVYMTSVVTSNGNYSSSSVSVKAIAVPKSIGGIKASSKKSTTLVYANGAEGSVELTYKDLDVLDQYGRVMSNDKVEEWLKNTTGGVTNVIVVKQAATVATSAVKVYQDADTTTDLAKAKLTKDATSKVKITAQADGSEKVEFSLSTDDAATVVSGSEKSITFATSTQKEFTSYTVDDLGTLYYDTKNTSSATHTVKPAVYGVKADGSKVKLLPAYYDITTNAKTDTAKAAVEVDAATGEIKERDADVYTDNDFKKADGSYQDVTVTATIQVKDTANGAYVETLTKDLKLSNKAPAVATAKFTSAVSDGKASLKVSAVNNTTATNLNALLDTSEVKDQYGVKSNDAAKISISNVEDADAGKTTKFAVTTGTNNSTTVAITGADVNDTFTVTYTWGSVSVKVDVIVIAD